MAYNLFFYSYFSLIFVCDSICLLDAVAGTVAGAFSLAAELDLIDLVDMGYRVLAVTRWPLSLTV